MKGLKARSILAFAIFVVAAFLGAGLFVWMTLGGIEDIRRNDAEDVLEYFQEAMVLKLSGDVAGTAGLAATARANEGDMDWFPAAAQELLDEEGIAYVAYVEDDTVRFAFPERSFQDTVGMDLNELPYVYTLAKVTNELVIGGPVDVATGDSVFLFIEPVLLDGAFVGEAVVGVRADYTVDMMGLSTLVDKGYRYELWAVSPQDGSREVIAVSDEGFDYSHAEKTSFNMPTQWTLSIIPADGWVTTRQVALVLVVGFALAAFLVVGVAATISAVRSRRELARVQLLDSETGLLTYAAFSEMVRNRAAKRPDDPATVVCLNIDDFEHVAFSVGSDERRRYLDGVEGAISSCVEGEHVAGRMGAARFAIVVWDRIGEHDGTSLVRSLELSLLWKVRIDGKRAFCRARAAIGRMPEDGRDPIDLVERLESSLERERVHERA